MNEFYLSIVAVSRNDDHGGQLLDRMQAFVDGVIQQSCRHELRLELILVEWNPPLDRPPLSEALKIPEDKPFCEIRIITVSPEDHKELKNSENIPLYQMIGKNVGIRRARGNYVLATNIDIIFSDELFKYFKAKKLRPGVVYRTDRLDIPSEIPKHVPFDHVLDYCYRNFFRINSRFETKVLNKKKMNFKKQIIKLWKKKRNFSKHFSFVSAWIRKLLKKSRSPNIIDLNRWHTLISQAFSSILKWSIRKNFRIWELFNFRSVKKRDKQKFFQKLKSRIYFRLHTNGCGDFTLMSYRGWETLRGYPEWPIFSWHIDSLFLYQAVISNFREKNFASVRPIYHIEHGIGSGYTPEGIQLLFNRLKKKSVPYIDMPTFNGHVRTLIEASNHSKTLLYNEENWGMIDHQFKEVIL